MSLATQSPPLPEHGTDGTNGKLVILDALDMSKLSLIKCHTLIHLSGPWSSSDLGRITTYGNDLPGIPGVSVGKARETISSLIKDGLMRSWKVGAATVWEVAGANVFKPGLKAEKRKLAEIRNEKENQKTLRSQRKKDVDAGLPFVRDDDNQGMDDDGRVIEKRLTDRGDLVPRSTSGSYYNCTAPMPKGRPRERVLLPQPDNAKDRVLHLLPPFNPAEGLSMLGTVARHYLLLHADDYGRVEVDMKRLWRNLGPGITKHTTHAKLAAEIEAMGESGHLLLVEKKSGKRFAFIRDAAQHKMGCKRRDMMLPQMHEDREFSHDNPAYLEWFADCKAHSAARVLVQVAQVNTDGDCQVIYEFVKQAAEKFMADASAARTSKSFGSLTNEQYCMGEKGPNTAYGALSSHSFWKAVEYKLPVAMLERICQEYDEINGTGSYAHGAANDTHKILTYLLGMTPREYIATLSQDGAPPLPGLPDYTEYDGHLAEALMQPWARYERTVAANPAVTGHMMLVDPPPPPVVVADAAEALVIGMPPLDPVPLAPPVMSLPSPPPAPTLAPPVPVVTQPTTCPNPPPPPGQT